MTRPPRQLTAWKATRNLDDLGPQVWNVLGLLLLLVAGYFIVSRTLLPQFALPWFGKQKRQRALERVEQLLAEGEMEAEARHRLERCRNTLIAFDARTREQWSGSLPVDEAVREIDEHWESRGTNRT